MFAVDRRTGPCPEMHAAPPSSMWQGMCNARLGKYFPRLVLDALPTERALSRTRTPRPLAVPTQQRRRQPLSGLKAAAAKWAAE